jgi:hypothetical protein
METTQPFAVALRELLFEHDYTSASGSPKWSMLAAQLEGVHYQTLLRAAAQKRPPTPKLMEECARVFRIRPEYFAEYRVYLAQRDFDPRVVGLDTALQNASNWLRRVGSPSSSGGEAGP